MFLPISTNVDIVDGQIAEPSRTRRRPTVNDNGIAWMIAGGSRNETLEDVRMRMHRIALAERAPSRADAWLPLRQRIAGVFAGRAVPPATSPALAADCCAA